MALVQLAVSDDKLRNITRAIDFIERAKQHRADIVVLPECFNSSYGTRKCYSFYFSRVTCFAQWQTLFY